MTNPNKPIYQNEWLYLAIGIGIGYFALPKLMDWVKNRNN